MATLDDLLTAAELINGAVENSKTTAERAERRMQSRFDKQRDAIEGIDTLCHSILAEVHGLRSRIERVEGFLEFCTRNCEEEWNENNEAQADFPRPPTLQRQEACDSEAQEDQGNSSISQSTDGSGSGGLRGCEQLSEPR